VGGGFELFFSSGMRSDCVSEKSLRLHLMTETGKQISEKKSTG
jgi:hypothetical protein